LIFSGFLVRFLKKYKYSGKMSSLADQQREESAKLIVFAISGIFLLCILLLLIMHPSTYSHGDNLYLINWKWNLRHHYQQSLRPLE
jgi:hypothetical protein